MNGLVNFTDKLSLDAEEVAQVLANGNEQLQVIVFDSLTKIDATYGSFVTLLKENISQILFGGILQKQSFVGNIPYNQQNLPVPRNVLHRLEEDSLAQIVIPTEVKD